MSFSTLKRKYNEEQFYNSCKYSKKKVRTTSDRGDLIDKIEQRRAIKDNKVLNAFRHHALRSVKEQTLQFCSKINYKGQCQKFY